METWAIIGCDNLHRYILKQYFLQINVYKSVCDTTITLILW